ncbi:MAG: hypothetical protein RMJ45_01080 [Candidatus Calescibacterium sp.]|nr:hypothetical protein [Candidatus Calescibacterium sp.]
MGKYDISFKELISGAEKELLSIVGLDVQELQPMNVEFASVREKRADKVYLCTVGSQKALAQIEVQLYYEKDFPVRMVGYWADLKLGFPNYPIIQIVLTCGKKLKDSIDEEFFSAYLKFRYILVDLCEIPFRKFLSFNNPNINAFGILSNDCNVRELIEKLLEYKLEKSEISSLVNKIYILSKLTERDREVLNAMEDIQKIDIRELELFQIGKKEGVQEGIEKGIKEGMQKGIKEGMQKGLREGLELALRLRFGAQAQKFITKIRKIRDVDTLREIAKKLQRAKTLRDIQKILDSN